jgi:hypothetical protein
MPIQDRYYPSKSTAVEHQRETVPGAVAYFYESTHSGTTHYYAYGWRSDKQINHDFHHNFGTDRERRDKWVNQWFDGLVRRSQNKQERKDKKAKLQDQPNPFKVGQVVVGSWGYDRTNVDFYVITEIRNKQVVIQKCGQEVVGNGGRGLDYVIACKDRLIGDPIVKTVQWLGEGQAYLSDKHTILTLWDGKKQCRTDD